MTDSDKSSKSRLAQLLDRITSIKKELDRHSNDSQDVATSSKPSDILLTTDDVVEKMRQTLEAEDESKKANDLEKKIIRQVEHYFGDYNLPKDRFMQEAIEAGHGKKHIKNRLPVLTFSLLPGWMSMATLMTFKRLSDLSQDPNVVMKALVKSRSGLLEVDVEQHRLRRDPQLPPPVLDDSRRLSLREKTVFVAGFDKNKTTLDELIEYFEKNFSRVCNVTMRRQREERQEEEEEQERVSLQYGGGNGKLHLVRRSNAIATSHLH